MRRAPLILALLGFVCCIACATTVRAQQPSPPPTTTVPAPLPPATAPATTATAPAPVAPPPSPYVPGYPPPGYAPGYGAPPGYGPPGYGPPVYGQPAYGPPSPYEPLPPPYIPPPPEERGVHLHDGLYVRMAFGMQYIRASMTVGSGPDATVSGTGLGFEVGVGGTPIPGWILGGRFLGSSAYGARMDDSNTTASGATDLSLVGLQAFTDVYPMPDQGFHLHVGAGVSSLGFARRYPLSSTDSYLSHESMSGLGVTFGAGYEGWVGQQWAIGGLVSLNLAWLENSLSSDTSGTVSNLSNIHVLSPSLLFTATYN